MQKHSNFTLWFSILLCVSGLTQDPETYLLIKSKAFILIIFSCADLLSVVLLLLQSRCKMSIHCEKLMVCSALLSKWNSMCSQQEETVLCVCSNLEWFTHFIKTMEKSKVSQCFYSVSSAPIPSPTASLLCRPLCSPSSFTICPPPAL